MKKILLCICLLSTFAAGLVGCSQQRQWNHEQRKAMREALRSYRQMVYLDDLSDDEFVLFTDEVAGDLEGAYPVYTTFVEMPGVTDTVDMVVVTTIVDELNAEEYGVAFRKGSDAAAAVDTAFDELKADGTMQALADKYDLALAD